MLIIVFCPALNSDKSLCVLSFDSTQAGPSRNMDPGPYACDLVHWAWFPVSVLG